MRGFFKLSGTGSDLFRLPQYEEKPETSIYDFGTTTDSAKANGEDEKVSVSMILSLFRSFLIITCIAGFFWLACSTISTSTAAAPKHVVPTSAPSSLEVKPSSTTPAFTKDSMSAPTEQIVVSRIRLPSLPTSLVEPHGKRQVIDPDPVRDELDAQKDRLVSVSSIWNDTIQVAKHGVDIPLSATKRLTPFIITVINSAPIAKRIQILKDFERGRNGSSLVSVDNKEQRGSDNSKAVAHWLYSMQDVQDYVATHPHELTLPTDIKTQDPEVQAKNQEQVIGELLKKIIAESYALANVTKIEITIDVDTNKNATSDALAKRKTATARDFLEQLRLSHYVNWGYLIHGLEKLLHDFDPNATAQFENRYDEIGVELLTRQIEDVVQNLDPQIKRIMKKGIWQYQYPKHARAEDDYCYVLTKDLKEMLNESKDSSAAELTARSSSGSASVTLGLPGKEPRYRWWIKGCAEVWLGVCTPDRTYCYCGYDEIVDVPHMIIDGPREHASTSDETDIPRGQ